MVMACVVASGGLVNLPPVTFVTGNTKKLEEVKVIFGQSNYVSVAKTEQT